MILHNLVFDAIRFFPDDYTVTTGNSANPRVSRSLYAYLHVLANVTEGDRP